MLSHADGRLPDNILIVGLAADCEETIASEIHRIQRAVVANNSVSFLIIESDSSDRTTEELERLGSTIKNFRYLSLGHLSESIPRRTDRIAYCRNVYLDEIKSNPVYSSADHIVVADMDGVNARLTRDAYLSCWRKNGWDVCTANQAGPYYDLWALRHPVWNPVDCWEQCRFMESLGVASDIAKYASVYSKMASIKPDADWIEVDSAFGGMAIYSRSALLSGLYEGTDAGGCEICEHVVFHRQLREQGSRIFINPALINAAETEHARHAGLKFLLRRRLRRSRLRRLSKLILRILKPVYE